MDNSNMFNWELKPNLILAGNSENINNWAHNQNTLYTLVWSILDDNVKLYQRLIHSFFLSANESITKEVK